MKIKMGYDVVSKLATLWTEVSALGDKATSAQVPHAISSCNVRVCLRAIISSYVKLQYRELRQPDEVDIPLANAAIPKPQAQTLKHQKPKAQI